MRRVDSEAKIERRLLGSGTEVAAEWVWSGLGVSLVVNQKDQKE